MSLNICHHSLGALLISLEMSVNKKNSSSIILSANYSLPFQKGKGISLKANKQLHLTQTIFFVLIFIF
jgi:hypothetical protein